MKIFRVVPNRAEISVTCVCGYCVTVCVLGLEKAVIGRLVSEGWEIHKGGQGNPLLLLFPWKCVIVSASVCQVTMILCNPQGSEEPEATALVFLLVYLFSFSSKKRQICEARVGLFSGRSVPWPRGSAPFGMDVHAALPGISPEEAACGLVF